MLQVIPGSVDLQAVVLAEPELLYATDSEVRNVVERLNRLCEILPSEENVGALMPRYSPKRNAFCDKLDDVIQKASILAAMLPVGFDLAHLFQTCPEALAVDDGYFEASLRKVSPIIPCYQNRQTTLAFHLM